jgi:flavodoxin
MKILVVYYSLEGNTRMIAEAISESVNVEMLEIKTKKEISSKGFMRYLWGGRQVVTKQKPALHELNKDLNDYDLLFIGTPVWAWSYAPALASLFSAHKITGKKIALFCCHGGGKGKVFDKMKEALSGNVFLGEIDFQDPLANDKEKAVLSVKQWARRIVADLDRQQKNS